MAQDLVVTLGLDDADFRRSLDRSGGYSTRKAWQIAKEFERAERAKERAAAASAAKMRRSYQRMQQAHQVAAVAIAAGAGVIYKALQKAAEGNADLRAKLEATGRAGERFMTQLGNDLSPLVGGFDDIIDAAGRARRGVSDFYAMFAMGIGGERKLKEVNAALADAERRNQAFASARAAQDIEAQISGNANDPDRDFRTQMNERINSVGDRATKIRLRESLARQLAQRQAQRAADAARAAGRSNADANQRRLDNAAAIADARAGRSPDDYDAQREAINARAAAQRSRAAEAVRRDDTIADPDKYRAIQEAMRVISAEQAAQLEAARQHNEELGRRRATVEQQQRLAMAAQRIELERAKGNTRQADAMALALEHERERLRIMNDQELSAERRAQMLANEDAIFSAQLNRLTRGGGAGAGRVIEAGFAGDSVTAGQTLGIRTEAKQLVDLTKSANDILKDIRDKDTVAIAG